MPYLLMLALDQLPATQPVNRSMLCCTHEPRTGIARNTRLRPLLESGNQSILRQFFGKSNVTDHPGQTRNKSRRLDPPEGIDRFMSFGIGYNALVGHTREIFFECIFPPYPSIALCLRVK
jgi:hypothetical protein